MSSPEEENKAATFLARISAFVSRHKILTGVVAAAVVAGAVVMFLQLRYEALSEAQSDQQEAEFERHEHQLYGTNAGEPSPPAQSAQSGADQSSTNQSSGAPAEPVPVNLISNRYCHALAPDGWGISDQDDTGAKFSVASPDGRLSAGYGDMGLTAILQGGGEALYAREHSISPFLAPPPQAGAEVMGGQYKNPLLAVEYTIQNLYGNDVTFDGAPDPYAQSYQMLRFSSAAKRGIVVFRAVSDYQGNQAVLIRMAAVDPSASDSELAETMAIATSVNCRQVLQPPPAPPAFSYQGSQPSQDNASQKCQVWSPNCDDSDFAGTYNAQLGTGWVHSESGQNYLRDPDTQKWEDGPDGPGYYIHHDNGNLEKLQPGWVDSD
jgi:hypothetical protein